MAITVYDDVPKPRGKITVYDEIDSSAFSDTARDLPEYARRAGSYASEGLAAVADMLPNVPTNLYNLGKAAYGTAITAAGRPDLAPELTPTPDLVRRGFEKAGFIDPNVVPTSETERIASGLAQAGAAGMLAPAKSLPQMGANVGAAVLSELAGQGTENVTGSKSLGTSARMLAIPAIAATSNALKASSIKARNLNTREEILREGRKVGFKVPRSATSQAKFTTNRLEDIAGKDATKQQYTIENQAVYNRLAREELGLPEGKIDLRQIEQKRAMASWPYDEVSRISPLAKNALQKLREFRNESHAQWRSWTMTGKPKAQSKAIKADSNAAMMEKTLERIATKSGRPELVPELRKARTYIAKTYDIEKVLDVASGDIDSMKLHAIDQVRKGRLTGKLKLMADFAGAWSKYSGKGVNQPPPDVSRVNLVRGAGGMGMGYAMSQLFGFDPTIGATIGLGASTIGPPLLRNMMGSGLYQNNINPRYLASYLPTQENAALRGILLSGAMDSLNREE